MSEPIWTPSKLRMTQSNMLRFIRIVKNNGHNEIKDYRDLYEWSISKPEQFWPAVWYFCGIRASKSWDTVLKNAEHMPGASWFSGVRLNFAENLLSRRDDKTAIVFYNEQGRQAALSYRKLYEQVAKLAAAMREMGIHDGDRVAGFMPNRPETVIAMLATTSLGAIWSSCSPDFASAGAVERFSQIAPRLLFAADGYLFKGKKYDTLVRISEITKQLPSVEKVIVTPYINVNPDISAIADAVFFDELLEPYSTSEIDFYQGPFDQAVYILYSSGTTGKPKCIVHGAGGTLLQHLKELVLHTDLNASDCILYYTTCGWMMWNWLISSLAVGTTVMLYDGPPLYPRPDILFDFAEQEGVTVFGASAKYFSALEKSGVQPGNTYRLQKLNTLLSTGSPLAPESFDYIYREIKSDMQVSSISGGTDIVSCFALGNPLLPVYRGELQCRGLGMKVEVFNDEGIAVRDEKGELVCTAAAPSMPLYFWNDPDNKKYRAAYFEKFPGIWAQGDYAKLTEHDSIIIYGRSDATLNPGGVRIGTAEIYQQVEKLPEVIESLAISQEWQRDVRIILFVRLADDLVLNDELIKLIKNTIRIGTTARHVPAKVIAVADIPRTISGKLVELAVRNVIHNQAVTNIAALANPQALEFFKNLPELQTN